MLYKIFVFTLHLLLILQKCQEAVGGTGYEFTMYEENLCDTLKCGKQIHTMCFLRTPPCPYKSSYHYVLEEFQSIEFKHLLITAHNGFRSRIANIMSVANMNRLAWDNWLATMALQSADRCNPYEDDRCTKMEYTASYDVADSYFRFDTDKWKHLAQNRFCITGAYMPRNIVQLAMCSWYQSRIELMPPQHLEPSNRIQQLAELFGENNFTHLAYPLTFRFGCSLDSYEDLYCINCIYYPFYRSDNMSILFELGAPGASCPARFPRKDDYYPGLCTDSEENSASYMKHALWITSIINILQVFYD